MSSLLKEKKFRCTSSCSTTQRSLFATGLLDPEQIVVHFEIFLGRHLRQSDPEVRLELGLEREVRLDVVPGPPELEVLPHAGPSELNRDQDQRRAALDAAALGLVPCEHPEREIEDVDPLFLNREAGLTEGLAQAQIERGAGQRGLEPVVGVARGGFVEVGVGLAQHGEELGGDVVDVARGLGSGHRGRRLLGGGKISKLTIDTCRPTAWLFAAAAVSLGSPFWFDLLSRIVRLLGMGKRSVVEG